VSVRLCGLPARAPGARRPRGPGQYQHATERAATLLQGAVGVLGVMDREACTPVLDGLHDVSYDGVFDQRTGGVVVARLPAYLRCVLCTWL
jgi:hypothetical protein